ncbi:Glycine N-methyltransferase, partial [Podarcis lilfordi]
MVDSIYRTRSLGVAAEGLPDQYANGRAAQVWQLYIGDTRSRTAEYKNWLVSLLHAQRCNTVLDLACGTGGGFFEGVCFKRVGNMTPPDMLKMALGGRKFSLLAKMVFKDTEKQYTNKVTMTHEARKPELGRFVLNTTPIPRCSLIHIWTIFGGREITWELHLKSVAKREKPKTLVTLKHRKLTYTETDAHPLSYGPSIFYRFVPPGLSATLAGDFQTTLSGSSHGNAIYLSTTAWLSLSSHCHSAL